MPDAPILSLSLDGLPEAVAAVTFCHQILFRNRAAISGVSREAAVGRSLIEGTTR